MKELVFLLEEQSARAMLEGIIPRLLDTSQMQIRYIVFEGKSDLEGRRVAKMRGYNNPNACFLVMRDQDSEPDCKVLKKRLTDKCVEAGKNGALVRIACHELETFYLADLASVEAGLGIKNLVKLQNKSAYRLPDAIVSPSDKLKEITKNNYQQIAGSRAIGLHLDLSNERSVSFKHLLAGIRRLVWDRSSGKK